LLAKWPLRTLRIADIEVPNRHVDMDSWWRSACYPRGSFYPLSSLLTSKQVARSLTPTFVSARLVGLAVKPACAFALSFRFPSGTSRPLYDSVTI